MKRFVEFLENIDWWHVAIFFWVISGLVECSFTADTKNGVAMGVQTRPEQKEERKKEPTVEDGPKADWK